MAQRAIDGAEGAAFSGREVAVRRPFARERERGYAIRSGGRVRGYADRLWLSNARFVVSRGLCCVVGTVLETRPKRPRRADWSEVAFDYGLRTFYEMRSYRYVRGARYVRLERGRIYAMGIEYGDPATSVDQPLTERDGLRVFTPERDRWSGAMGGLNYERPDDEAVARALEDVFAAYPGAVVVDGTDDWFAPELARPELFMDLFEVEALALWHTGASGTSTSGIVLTEAEYERLNERYHDATGTYIEEVRSLRPKGSNSTCGCWDGSAFRVYRRLSDGTWGVT